MTDRDTYVMDDGTDRRPPLTLTRCENCGKARAEHHVVNFADGQMVSGETLVCPTAIYSPVSVNVCKRGAR